MNAQNAIVQPVRQVEEEINMLRSRLNYLADLTNEVVSRVSPVVSMSEGPSSVGGAPKAPLVSLCPVADQIRDIRFQAEGTIERLNMLLSGLQI